MQAHDLFKVKRRIRMRYGAKETTEKIDFKKVVIIVQTKLLKT